MEPSDDLRATRGPGLEKRILDGEQEVFLGALPEALTVEREAFEDLWNLHPEARHEVYMRGKKVATARWQQAYSRNYRFSGNQLCPSDSLQRPAISRLDARQPGAPGRTVTIIRGGHTTRTQPSNKDGRRDGALE